MLQSSKPRYMLSWPVFMKFRWKIDKRNTLVPILISRRLWELFRLPKQPPHWCNSAKRYWTTFPPTILWDFCGSLDIGNEISDGLTREGTVHQFVWLEPALGVSRQITIRKTKHRIHSQRVALWWVLTSIQRQAQKLISDPVSTAKIRPLSFNRIRFRVVTGLLAGRDTLRRHRYIMGLIGIFLCRRCGAEKETSAHVLFEREALVALWYTYLCSFSLDPEDIKSLSLGAVWNFIKGTGLPWFGHQFKGHKGQVKKACALGPEGLKPSYYSILSVLSAR